MITTNYLDIPKRLIIDVHDNHLALGIFCLVCRLFIATGGAPVPLSRGDVQRFDPSVKEGRFKRAVARLMDEGWLLERGGYKGTYVPSWGRKRGTPPAGPYREDECHLWAVGKPRLGCPVHIAVEAIRIDRNLLDLFVGRLMPGRRFSRIERYVTAPLLGLGEIGAYLAARVGYAITDAQVKALWRWGLWRDGQAVVELPGEREVLAMVSQRATPDGPRLTEAGWRRARLLPSQTAETPPREGQGGSSTLFFVPKEWVGELILQEVGQWVGELIGHADAGEGRFAAPTSAESDLDQARANMQEIPSEPSESREIPPHPHTPPSGGGSRSPNRHNKIPNTPTAQLLLSIGCYPSSASELAGMPLAQVEQVIAYAQAQTNITSVAAWAVDALRRIRDGAWSLPEKATPAAEAERWSAAHTAQIAGGAEGLFRLGSDTSDLEDDAGQAGLDRGSGPGALVTDFLNATFCSDAVGAHPPDGIKTGKLYAKVEGTDDLGPESDAKEVHHNVPAQDDVTPGATLAPPVPTRPGGRATPAVPGQNRAMCSNGTETLTGRPVRNNGVIDNAKEPGGAGPADRAAPPAAAGPPAAQGDPESARAYVLNRQVRETLRQRCDRGYHEAISRLTLQVAEGRTTVVCARRADRSIMADVLIGALRAALAEAGLPTEVEVVVQGAAPPAQQPWGSSHGGFQ